MIAVVRAILLTFIVGVLVGYACIALRWIPTVACDGVTFYFALDAGFSVTIDDPSLILHQRALPTYDLMRVSTAGMWFPPIQLDDPYYTLPYWLFLLVTVPAWVVLQHRALRRRVREGACLACGYDVTGNVSGVCSECGGQTRSFQESKGARKGPFE